MQRMLVYQKVSKERKLERDHHNNLFIRLACLPVKRPSNVRRSLKRLLCELFTKVVTLVGLPLRFRRFKVTLWLTDKRIGLMFFSVIQIGPDLIEPAKILRNSIILIAKDQQITAQGLSICRCCQSVGREEILSLKP